MYVQLLITFYSEMSNLYTLTLAFLDNTLCYKGHAHHWFSNFITYVSLLKTIKTCSTSYIGSIHINAFENGNTYT